MNDLSDAAPILREMAYGRDVSAEDMYRAMEIVNAQDRITDADNSDGLYFLAATFGLMAKGPSVDELDGVVRSISGHSVRLTAKVDPCRLIDISGTGGDKVKTFNVGTAASILIAAAGGYVAKQATRGYTGFTGSADVYQAFGLDPFRASPDSVVRCLEKVGISAFYTPAMSTGFKNRIDFLTKLRAIGLTYPTPWHLVSWVYSPFTLGARLYGVFDQKYLSVLAELFSRLDCRRVMVVHGLDGLDELSNLGETAIVEVRNGVTREYVLTPEEVGLERASLDEILSLPESDLAKLNDTATTAAERASLRERAQDNNIADFVKIVYGVDKGAKRDLAVMNAGAGIYLCGLAESIQQGIDVAGKMIDSGAARKKLRALVECAGDIARLTDCESRFV